MPRKTQADIEARLERIDAMRVKLKAMAKDEPDRVPNLAERLQEFEIEEARHRAVLLALSAKGKG